MDTGGVDDEAGGNIVEGDEDGICGEEKVREIDTSNCTVVKCSLKPLSRERIRAVFVQVRKMASESADSLAAHRVSLTYG